MVGDEDIQSVEQFDEEDLLENNSREIRSAKRSALFRDIESRMITTQEIEHALQTLIDMGRLAEGQENRLEVYSD